MRRPFVLFALAAALALALAPTASAQTIHLNWHERAPTTGIAVMTIDVHALRTQGNLWAATVTFRNLTQTALRIEPHFALGVYRTKKAQQPFRLFLARAYSPKLPRAIKPKQRWSGTYGGSGRIPDGAYVRIILGDFLSSYPPPLGPRIAWVTDHAYRYSLVQT